MFPVPPSIRAKIEVNVSYPGIFPSPGTTACGKWPILGIYTTQDHVNIKQRCSNISYGQLGNADLHPHLTTYLDYSKTLNCRLVSNSTNCFGNITVQDFIPRNISFSFGFFCNQTGSLRGLVCHLQIDERNESNCLSEKSFCDGITQSTVFPNLFGETPIEDFYISRRILISVSYPNSCDVYNLQCDPETNAITPPCREICQVYSRNKDNIFWKYLNCNYLPSFSGNMDCFYQQYFTNLTQTTTTTQTTKTTQTTQTTLTPLSGYWVIIIACIVIVILIIFIFVLCKIRLKAKQGITLNKEKLNLDIELNEDHENCVAPVKRDKKFDSFVLYLFDSNDDFVVNRVVNELEVVRDFKLCIHSRDFTPGRDIIDNIQEAIENSNSAIIVMSQGFVDSMWGKKKFMHCCLENMKDAAFNLFVIMMQPVDTLVYISPYMKTFFANKTYLEVDDPELFSKLATHL